MCSSKPLQNYQFREMVLAVAFCLCLMAVGLQTGNQLPTKWTNLLHGLCEIHSLEGAGRLGQEIGMDHLYYSPLH